MRGSTPPPGSAAPPHRPACPAFGAGSTSSGSRSAASSLRRVQPRPCVAPGEAAACGAEHPVASPSASGPARPPARRSWSLRCAAYSRTSWRDAISAEGGAADTPAALSSREDAREPPARRSSGSWRDGGGAGGDTPPAGDGPRGGGGGVCGSPTLSELDLRVKLSLAASSGRLDLTDCRLSALPPQVLELTELEELQLSGNCLAALPEGVSRLTALRRLGLAGNCLEALPAGLGALVALEGLWLHGNLLRELPEQLGGLQQLRALSLAGNRLTRVAPGSLSRLTALTDLTLAGNRLTALPPRELAPLTGLRKLALNGNRLAACPEGLGALGRLTELSLQGNQLERVDPGVFECTSLVELSLADNRLAALPPRLAAAASLSRLALFGNRLAELPVGQLAALPALCALWLEGNPLAPGCTARLAEAAQGGGMPRLKALGLDQQQVSQLPEAVRAGLRAPVRVGCVLGSGPGYFKLQYGPGAAPDPSALAPGSAALAAPLSRNALLVVAFGSAPGTPNWAGLLSKVYKAAGGEAEKAFDVLYVADPHRDWYGGGSTEGEGGQHGPPPLSYYRARLSAYCAAYRRVLLLGDSMGASAALLCADLATGALAFCPQVDLTTASIRPGRRAEWLAVLRGRMMDAVRASPAATAAGAGGAGRGGGLELSVLVGTWQHDLDQANCLPQRGGGPQRGEDSGSGSDEAAPQGGGGRRRGGSGSGGWRSEGGAEQPAGATARRTPWSWDGRQGGGGEGEGDGTAGGGREAGAESGPGGVVVRVFGVDSHRLAAALDAQGKLVGLVRGAVLQQLGLRAGQVRLSNIL